MTWQWVAALMYGSPIYYAYGGAVRAEFEDNVYGCPTQYNETDRPISECRSAVRQAPHNLRTSNLRSLPESAYLPSLRPTAQVTSLWPPHPHSPPLTLAAAEPCVKDGNEVVKLYTSYPPSKVFPILFGFVIGSHLVSFGVTFLKVKMIRR